MVTSDSQYPKDQNEAMAGSRFFPAMSRNVSTIRVLYEFYVLLLCQEVSQCVKLTYKVISTFLFHKKHCDVTRYINRQI